MMSREGDMSLLESHGVGSIGEEEEREPSEKVPPSPIIPRCKCP
jgi:hypothetical protein